MEGYTIEILKMPKNTFFCTCGCIFQWSKEDVYSKSFFNLSLWVRCPLCLKEYNIHQDQHLK